MVNDWLQTPLLRALRNKLSRRLLSAFDNCPANDGRATDSTMALNITSKAANVLFQGDYSVISLYTECANKNDFLEKILYFSYLFTLKNVLVNSNSCNI